MMIVSARDASHSSGRIDCLVTGATGLVGNNVVRMLVDQRHDVRVLVRPGQWTAAAGDSRKVAGRVRGVAGRHRRVRPP